MGRSAPMKINTLLPGDRSCSFCPLDRRTNTNSLAHSPFAIHMHVRPPVHLLAPTAAIAYGHVYLLTLQIHVSSTPPPPTTSQCPSAFCGCMSLTRTKDEWMCGRGCQQHLMTSKKAVGKKPRGRGHLDDLRCLAPNGAIPALPIRGG